METITNTFSDKIREYNREINQNLKVSFADKIDNENYRIHIQFRDYNNLKEKTLLDWQLIGTGQLNICTNMAHVILLDEKINKNLKEYFEGFEGEIGLAIEKRDIHNYRINPY
tara:strand:+ start:1163 stop:1501 length:339 start_codon:yes stop_codon:yes gene_type:complete